MISAEDIFIEHTDVPNISVTEQDSNTVSVEISQQLTPFEQNGQTTESTDYKSSLQDKEHQIILETLSRCQGKRKDVAEVLGMSPRTLRYKLAKMRDLGIALPA